jgi:hypothetical protein
VQGGGAGERQRLTAGGGVGGDKNVLRAVAFHERDALEAEHVVVRRAAAIAANTARAAAWARPSVVLGPLPVPLMTSAAAPDRDPAGRLEVGLCAGVVSDEDVAGGALFSSAGGRCRGLACACGVIGALSASSRSTASVSSSPARPARR